MTEKTKDLQIWKTGRDKAVFAAEAHIHKSNGEEHPLERRNYSRFVLRLNKKGARLTANIPASDIGYLSRTTDIAVGEVCKKTGGIITLYEQRSKVIMSRENEDKKKFWYGVKFFADASESRKYPFTCTISNWWADVDRSKGISEAEGSRTGFVTESISMSAQECYELVEQMRSVLAYVEASYFPALYAKQS
jgi:hypothetical protein